MSTRPELTFGLVVPGRTADVSAQVDHLVSTLAARMQHPVVRRDAKSYEALVDDIEKGHTDVAWLPPIAFVRLGGAVTPLGSIVRDGNSTYEAALVVHAKSHIRTLDGLKGTRAGWVDRWSASGYVLPRMNLSLSGVDPRTLFRAEAFHGSHRAAIQALLDGLCDVTGTYARADDSGNVTTGAWSEIGGASVRVLTTFGAIPPDVIAVRTAIDAPTRVKVWSALESLAAEDKPLLRVIFGGDDLREGSAPGYESLKAALEMATARGIFQD